MSRRSWVRRSSATSRGGVPSGVPTRGSWAHTVVYVADRSYSSDRWEPHSRSLTMTRVFTITAALICVCSASLVFGPSPCQPHDAQPSVAPDVLRLASPSLRPHCSDSGLWFAPLWNNPRGRTMRGCGHLDSERRSAIWKLLCRTITTVPKRRSRKSRNAFLYAAPRQVDGKRALLTFSDHCDTSPQLFTKVI